MSPGRSIKERFRDIRRSERYAEVEASVLGWLIWAVLWFLRLTTRFECRGAEQLQKNWDGDQPMVFAFWHGRAIMLPFLVAGKARDVYIMNSTHRDGEIITRALERFGLRTTRGSASKKAVAGTLGLLRALKGGASVALIPDGPRGPAGQAKGGAAELAMRTGAPLFPLAFSANRVYRATGWDRMMLPLPGARVVCLVGEPFEATEKKPSKDKRERLRSDLEQRLQELTRRADREAGRTEEDW